jgi:hypothetical protein
VPSWSAACLNSHVQPIRNAVQIIVKSQITESRAAAIDRQPAYEDIWRWRRAQRASTGASIHGCCTTRMVVAPIRCPLITQASDHSLYLAVGFKPC